MHVGPPNQLLTIALSYFNKVIPRNYYMSLQVSVVTLSISLWVQKSHALNSVHPRARESTIAWTESSRFKYSFSAPQHLVVLFHHQGRS